MPKKILLLGFLLVCCIGLYTIITKNPTTPSGTVSLMKQEDTEPLTGYVTVRKFRDNVTEYDLPVIRRLAERLPEIKQPLPAGTQDFLPNVNLRFSGEKSAAPTYTIYTPEGEKLSGKSETLILPAGKHRDFVVRVSVRWGKENNYTLTNYYFRVLLSDSSRSATQNE